MKRCPSCNSAFPTDYTHCPRDGSTLAETDEWSVGTLVRGKYQILAKVGQGGMGAVYKAMHVHFNELRALKVISGELASDAAFVRRFEQEAVMTRKLQHPNAVRVEDIDHAEDGRPFIVMEYIEGRNLKDVIEQEAPLAARRVCSIVKQVADALNAAHELGIVHRDIKPANLALVRSNKGTGFRGEQAKVFDFGIAKLKEDHLGDTQARHLTHLTLTGTGVVIGTPAYMSPEQAKGFRGDQLDGRSDLYSLGIVAYQLLTGDLPLKADSTVEQLMAHINTVPKPLNFWPELEIPAEVATVVMRCLEKNRELRPASGRDLIAALTLAESSSLPLPVQATATPLNPVAPSTVASNALEPSAVEPSTVKSRVTKPSGTKPGAINPSQVRRQAPALRAPPSGTARARVWVWAVAVALVVAASAGTGWYLRKERRVPGQEDRQVASANAEPAPNPLNPPKPAAGVKPTTPSGPSAGPAASSQLPATPASPSQVSVRPSSVSPPANSAPNKEAVQNSQPIASNAAPGSNHENGAAASADIKPQSAVAPGQTSAGTAGNNAAVPESPRTLPPSTQTAGVEPISGPGNPVAGPSANASSPSSEHVGERGKAWLDAQKDPPAINVTGSWNSEEWGDLRLTQTQGSRDVSGEAPGYELTGVISGKRLFLLFHNGKGKVDYCATLDAEANNRLSGGYSSRVTRLRFGHGLCQEKSRPMHLSKQ